MESQLPNICWSRGRGTEGKPPPNPEKEKENNGKDSDDEDELGDSLGEQPVESETEDDEQPITSNQSSMPIAVAQTASQERQTCLARKLAIRKLKQTLGWMEAEISPHKREGTHDKESANAEETERGSGGRLDLRRRLYLREKYGALMRVKVLQQRRCKELKARKLANENFDRMGP